MPIDYRKNAAMRHRALMMTVDMDEPMGGYPKSKAPELVVEPIVAMPDARLVAVGGTGTEPPTSYNWGEGNSDYTAMPEAIEQVFDTVTAGPVFGTLIASNRGLPRKPQWPNGKPGWPKGKPRKPAE